MTKNLRVLILNEGCHVVAQCLDYDIAGQGDDVESALKEFSRLLALHHIVAEEKQMTPLANIGPAPDFYQEKWERT